LKKLVQNATEAKNLPDNFIGSIIDDENHSLLHYLVVRGDDAGIQMVLETNSTRKTTCLESSYCAFVPHANDETRCLLTLKGNSIKGISCSAFFSPFPSNVMKSGGNLEMVMEVTADFGTYSEGFNY
jgi:ribosomal protein S6E (S10)